MNLLCDDNLELLQDEVDLGRLSPNTKQQIEIPCITVKSNDGIELLGSVKWKDFDGKAQSEDFVYTLDTQKSKIDWSELQQSDPYSLEPVSDADELVGRRYVLNKLIGSAKGKSVGSTVIHGQKRVGKTSIANALLSHLNKLDFITVFLTGGDYVEPSAQKTISRLGKRICKEILSSDGRLTHLKTPNFEDALSPLAEFLSDSIKLTPDRNIVIFLDEFDELPLDLYSRGPLGDSFFLTLRSICSSKQVGFVLVGSEKMLHILDCQGEKLNKWKFYPVDYFSKEKNWGDFKELIQRPVGDNLEFSEMALIELHAITAGNPYFSKFIAERIFQKATERRDCHVTQQEVQSASSLASQEATNNNFQHFWDDGIFETGPKFTEKSTRRRYILLTLADIIQQRELDSSIKNISDHPLLGNFSDSVVDSELKEFESRNILTSNNSTYNFKVPFFFNWLKGKGVCDLIATFSTLDIALKKLQEIENLKVTASEIYELISSWRSYKGQKVTEDKVRLWLEQFGKIENQRMMYNLLNGVNFLSDNYVREKMRDIDEIVKRGMIHKIKKGKLKRSDILVSYLDKPAKSGAHFARIYADEASIYVENVVAKNDLLETIKNNHCCPKYFLNADFGQKS